MRDLIHLQTTRRECLVDITADVRAIAARSQIDNGLVSVYAQGATAAIMVQENWDESVQNDVVDLLQRLIPRGVWQHDAQDGNGDAHLKAGIVGPSETVPLIEGTLVHGSRSPGTVLTVPPCTGLLERAAFEQKSVWDTDFCSAALGLSTWQNIFFCEFDGPRSDRRVVVTVVSDSDAR